MNIARIYAETYRAYKESGDNYTDDQLKLISWSNLVMSAPITTGISNLNFNVNVAAGTGTTKNWEVRLQQTDAFKICRIGFYAYGLIGTSTGPAGSTSYKYWTYAPIEATHTFVTVAPLWDSGTLQMNLNSTNYISNWTTNKHMVVPRTQMQPLQTITTSGAQNAASQPSLMLGDDGKADCEPTVFVQGNWKNNIGVTLNNPAGVAPVTNFAYLTSTDDTVYLNIDTAILEFEGLLCQNLTAILGPPSSR